MKETNIDAMKYRKSTHLAGVDVELVIAEKGKCEYTIKEAYYATGVDVSGNKTNGYFLEFMEPDVKPMVVNSTNRKIISDIVKATLGCSAVESRNIGNWAGFKIEFGFDPNVKMAGKTVGGIIVIKPKDIKPIDVTKETALLKSSKALDELKNNFMSLDKDKQRILMSLKDELKSKLEA